MQRIKITASVVIYKNEPEQIRLLLSCLLDTKIISRIYLIDNSPDKISASTLKLPQKCEYIFTGSNIGYGAGHNIAIRKSLALNSKYHLVVNPDISFKKGTLEKVLKYMDEHPDTGLLMPKILYPDGSTQYLCKLLPTPFDWIFRRFLPIKKYVEKRNNLFELRFSGYDKIMVVPYLSGCFMCFRTDALKETGLFDEKIFMYGEDTDITRRIYQYYKTIYYPFAEAVHEFHKESYKNIKLLLVHIKSAIYYFIKWGWFFDRERREINKEVLEKIKNNIQ
ncbi:MAG: glycosyltransferase family 2 protein [Spirochaetota bacterium]